MRRKVKVARTTTGKTVNVTLVDGDHTSTVTIRVTSGIAQAVRTADRMAHDQLAEIRRAAQMEDAA